MLPSVAPMPPRIPPPDAAAPPPPPKMLLRMPPLPPVAALATLPATDPPMPSETIILLRAAITIMSRSMDLNVSTIERANDLKSLKPRIVKSAKESARPSTPLIIILAFSLPKSSDVYAASFKASLYACVSVLTDSIASAAFPALPPPSPPSSSRLSFRLVVESVVVSISSEVFETMPAKRSAAAFALSKPSDASEAAWFFNDSARDAAACARASNSVIAPIALPDASKMESAKPPMPGTSARSAPRLPRNLDQLSCISERRPKKLELTICHTASSAGGMAFALVVMPCHTPLARSPRAESALPKPPAPLTKRENW